MKKKFIIIISWILLLCFIFIGIKTAVREWKIRKNMKAVQALEESNKRKMAETEKKLKEEDNRRIKRKYEELRAEWANCPSAETPAARQFGFTAQTYPKVDGSTSTHSLGVLIACKFLNVSYAWTDKHNYNGKNKNRFPSYRLLAENESVNSLIQHSGTHSSYVKLIKGETDLILAARLPSEDELKLARERNTDLETKPVALDAFVFIVYCDNPVSSLSTKQIQDIYTGKITSWRNAGVSYHNNKAYDHITAYQRNRNSGSQQLMLSLVMKGLTMPEWDDADKGDWPPWILSSMGAPIAVFSSNINAIAYTVYYYEHFMAGSPYTKVIGVDGIMPSYETILYRKYPYVTEVYAVVRKSLRTASNAYRLRDWLLSSEGQAAVKESGYVPSDSQEQTDETTITGEKQRE